jgi:hypothetical protein
MQKSDMQFLHILRLGNLVMSYETSSSSKWLFGTAAVITILGAVAGFYFWNRDGSLSLIHTEETPEVQASDLCLDEGIQAAAIESVASAIADRTQSGPWQNGGQRLRVTNDFVGRLTLSQISYHGYSKVGNKIGCWATVSIAPPEPDFENAAYDQTARIMFSAQNTLDGSGPVIMLEYSSELGDRANRWARAEVLYDPSAELRSALGAWKELDDEMKAAGRVRSEQTDQSEPEAAEDIEVNTDDETSNMEASVE